MSQPGTSLPVDLSETELQSQREALRRGLRRVNAAWGVIWAVLVALALGVFWKAGQSERDAERAGAEAHRANHGIEVARSATIRAEDELWNAKLNEARFRRIAGGPGSRTAAEALLRELVQRPNLSHSQRLALRREAVAQLALVDVAIAPTNGIRLPADYASAWDRSLSRYVRFGNRGTVEVHDYASSALAYTLQGPTNVSGQAAVFSADSKFLAVRFHGGDVVVWDTQAREEVTRTRCMRIGNSRYPLFFSKRGATLGMLGTNGLSLLEVADAASPRNLQSGRPLRSADFSPDGTQVAVIPMDDLSVIEIWDIATGIMRKRIEVGFVIWSWDWHPTGTRIVTGGEFGEIRVWNLGEETGLAASNALGNNSDDRIIRDLRGQRLEGHTGGIILSAFTPDGSSLLTYAWDSTSGIWDVISGRRLLTETRVSFYDVSSRGDRIVGVWHQNPLESLYPLLNRSGFRTIAASNRSRPVHGVWMSPDNKLAAVCYPHTKTGGPPECQIWDLARRMQIKTFHAAWVEFTPDGHSLLAFDSRSLRRYAILAGEFPTLVEAEEILQNHDRLGINTGGLSANGKTIVMAAFEHVDLLEIGSSNSPRVLNVPAHYAVVSPDGRFVATRIHNDHAYVRDAAKGNVLKSFPVQSVPSFSPNGRWMALAQREKVELYEPGSWRKIWEIPIDGASIAPPALAFSDDSSTFAVSYNRYDISLHETSTGGELVTFSPRFPSQIIAAHGLTFSRDGKWLVAAKEDGEVVGWELPVVREHLASIGLDWTHSAGTPERFPIPVALHQPTNAPKTNPTGDFQSGWHGHIGAFAFAAAGLAVLAGGFVFVVQRRMIASYARVEALAVTQRQKLHTAQNELVHSEKMRALGTLAAGIAHDFNNLLSVIRLSNQLAAEQSQARGLAKENMDAIETAVNQGEHIVNSMLGYSRSTAEAHREYAVADAVNESVAMLGRKFLSGIILKLEIAPSLPLVHGVRGRLEQMLLNLIVNASEAMAGQGELRLTVRSCKMPVSYLLAPGPGKQYVEILVSDSGPGIPTDVLPRIFEPFFTTKQTGARRGTGLGLATVYTMAQQDGLGLGVDTADGRGTTFRILVPV